MTRNIAAVLAGVLGGVVPLIVLLALLLMAGCSQEPPEVRVIATPPQPPHFAPECVSPDQPWPRLPEGRDITEPPEVWRYLRAAKDRYDGLTAKRETCRASLLAQRPAPAMSAK